MALVLEVSSKREAGDDRQVRCCGREQTGHHIRKSSQDETSIHKTIFFLKR